MGATPAGAHSEGERQAEAAQQEDTEEMRVKTGH